MRLAILSDVHGNLPALEAVLADARSHGVDGYVVAGDLALGGPFPVETLERLRALNPWMIRGNNEGYFDDYRSGAKKALRSRSQWAMLRWTHAQLGQEALDFLAALPATLKITPPGAGALCVVHGSHRSAFEGIQPPDPDVQRKFAQAQVTAPLSVEAALAQTATAVLICGHTHIAWQHRVDGQLALNPGAVGGPIDGVVGAEYALLTWDGARWTAELRVVDYDMDRLRAAFHDRGLFGTAGPMARALLRSVETGQNYAWFFVLHAQALAAQAGLGDDEAIPDEIWERAATTFNWET
ncbi:MAG: metallophosphoesterase family protein [Anaerolineae bacterium]|nr:metallophosphoesterase family protein [Anaerolineae bacterium]